MSYRYVSADGLAWSNDQRLVATWNQVGRDMAMELAMAIADLRAQGVKAAHPDDGWVDRRRNEVRFVYPAFNDGVQVGDVIALGWPWSGYRLVRVVEVRLGAGLLSGTVHFVFEEWRR